MKLLSHVWLFATHGLYVAHQAPPSMGFPKQEYWSGLPFPSPGIFLGSSRPRDWTQVSHIGGRCFNLWATREALLSHSMAGQMYRQTWLVSLPLSNWNQGVNKAMLYARIYFHAYFYYWQNSIIWYFSIKVSIFS